MRVRTRHPLRTSDAASDAASDGANSPNRQLLTIYTYDGFRSYDIAVFFGLLVPITSLL